MRALSFKEPFASLMLCGKIETRPWQTKYRGPVLICATQSSYSDGQLVEICGHNMKSTIVHTLEMLCPIAFFQNGNAFAVAELVDCRPMTKADEANCFVKHKEGLYCHVYENVKRIKPIPFKGTQGWQTVKPEVIEKLEYIKERGSIGAGREEVNPF